MNLKKYKIKTLKDIVDCTNKNNIDNFMIDLKNAIETMHNNNNIDRKTFIWVDDGKYEQYIIKK